MRRGWFFKKSPLDGKALCLSLPSSASHGAAEERDGRAQGYAGKLSFFPFRTARRQRGQVLARDPAEGTASNMGWRVSRGTPHHELGRTGLNCPGLG